jgi:hypothetical protein
MQNKTLIAVLLISSLVSTISLSVLAEKSDDNEDNGHAIRAHVLQNAFGTYCNAPRLQSGRVDIQRLTDELADAHANTYSFCIHNAATDWDDLQQFLPLAAKQGIHVWASLVPPSESPPRTRHYAEPFRLDYKKWAVELARLSLRETNLVAWSIDDFTYNLKFYAPNYLKDVLGAAREINPRLAFLPCCYYKSITPAFVKDYQPLIDGILFPYRHESGGANLTDASLVGSEVGKIKGMTNPSFPILIDVYATAHSKLGKSTPEYVQQVMTAGKSCADGVLVYCRQDPALNPEKYQIIKQLFTAWSGKTEVRTR